MAVEPACPVSAGPAISTTRLEFTYFPWRRNAAIKNPQSLTLRLVFNGGSYVDKDRSVSFKREADGRWTATLPLSVDHYAIWYVRDDAAGLRDDNHGQYWDVLFCDGSGKKLPEGIRSQAEGYGGADFSDEIRRPADYGRAIAILEENIDPSDMKSEFLVYDEWLFKLSQGGDRKHASPEMVKEVEDGLARYAGAVGYVEGTSQFVVSWDQAFPPALVERAIAASEQVNPHSRRRSDLQREQAENERDPRKQAQALGKWLAQYPDDAVYGNEVREERLGIFQDLGDVTAAEECFRDLISRVPHNADAYTTMAAIYIAKGVKAKESGDLLDEAERSQGADGMEGANFLITLQNNASEDPAILNYWRGRWFIEEGRWQEAEQRLLAASAKLQEAGAYRWLAVAQEERRELEKAKGSYLEAITHSSVGKPKDVEKFVELSLRTGTPDRKSAMAEIAGARKRDFDAEHYKPAVLDMPEPDFTLTTRNGAKITATSLRGQTVVLDLWATWCGPCVDELAGFSRLKKLHPELKVILAANDSEAAEVDKILRRSGFASEDAILIDDQNKAKFGMNGVPQTFLISKEGRIRAMHYGEVSDVPLFLEADLAAAGR